jgi:hypothetical protein
MRAAGLNGESEFCTRTSHYAHLEYYGTAQRTDFIPTWSHPVPVHVIKIQFTYLSVSCYATGSYSREVTAVGMCSPSDDLSYCRL